MPGPDVRITRSINNASLPAPAGGRIKLAIISGVLYVALSWLSPWILLFLGYDTHDTIGLLQTRAASLTVAQALIVSVPSLFLIQVRSRQTVEMLGLRSDVGTLITFASVGAIVFGILANVTGIGRGIGVIT